MLDAHSTRLAGQIILTPRVSMLWLSVISALIGAAVIAFLFLGSYTRRVTVTGQLLPTSGVIRIQTPQPGLVLEKRVEEGQLVSKGEVLFVLTSDRPGVGSGNLQAEIGVQVNRRQQSMRDEIARNEAAANVEIGSLERRSTNLRAEGDAIAKQTAQQLERLRLAEEARARYQGLADKDFIPREQLYQKEAELSEQRSRLQALQRDALVAQRELTATLREIEGTRARFDNLNAQLQRSISSAAQELTEVESRRRVVIAAPESGRATLVTAEVGQAIDMARTLATLVPVDAQLQARLYAPSQTVGFVRPGDKVLLRYQAFPYQKFGQHEGTVVSVSNNAVPSTELAGFALPNLPPGRAGVFPHRGTQEPDRAGLRRAAGAGHRHAGRWRCAAGAAPALRVDAGTALQHHRKDVSA